jgi:hypothetical protein
MYHTTHTKSSLATAEQNWMAEDNHSSCLSLLGRIQGCALAEQ